MYSFAVWAPGRKSVCVQFNGVSHPMHSARHGWWKVDAEDAGHGSDYGFLLDDDPQVYPDPRSPWQPYGVHGLSRVVDQSIYQWKSENFQQEPLSRSIIYELHIGTFTKEGTFSSAETKLHFLRSLGVTHVELMPLNSFTGKWGWGYDGVSLFAPQEQYGGPEALKHFVDACHASGLAVLLDVVYNHFGPVGNYTGKFGPYTTESHHTPWGGAVNLEEGGSTEVRRFFADNAAMWLRDYRFDGLRLDAVQSFVDRSASHFLEQLSEEVEELSQELDRALILIAESDLNDPRVVSPRYGHEGSLTYGYGLDAQWSDDFHHAVFAFLTGQRHTYYKDFGSLAQVAKSLKSVFIFDGIFAENRGRNHGRPVKDLSAHRFLGYTQNHDQIGNQAYGDRIGCLIGHRRAKIAAALVLTAPFVPMLFQGEEFGSSCPFLYFANHDDPVIARSVSEGRRLEHAHEGDAQSIPDPEAEETFLNSKLNWSELNEPEHADMLHWYKSLIQLRLSNPSLLDGDLTNVQVTFDEQAEWLVLQRGPMHLLFNFSGKSASLPIPPQAQLLLSSVDDVRAESQFVSLPENSFAAFLAIEKG